MILYPTPNLQYSPEQSVLCDSFSNLKAIFSTPVTQTSFLNIVHLNIRSIHKHFDEFISELTLSQFQFDLIILTENHLKSEVPYDLKDYTTFHAPSVVTEADGVTIFCHKKLNNLIVKNFSQIKTLKSGNVSILNFVLHGETYDLISVYRSPSSCPQMFIENLEYLLNNPELRNKSSTVIIIGDINIDISSNSRVSNNYLNVLYSNGFHSYVNIPTRVTENSKTCIDHCFIRLKNNTQCNPKIKSAVIEVQITDHYPIVAQIPMETFQQQHTKNTLRERIDYDKLYHDLSNETWKEITSTNVNKKVETFQNIIIKHINNNTMIYSKTTNKNTTKLKPWINDKIINSINERNNLYKKLKANPDNQELKLRYTLFRNFVNKMIRNAKAKYYNEKIEQHLNNPQKLWNIINEILHRSPKNKKNTIEEIKIGSYLVLTTENPTLIANHFNDFFISVGSESNQTPVIENYTDETTLNNTTFELKNITMHELEKAITDLKDKKASKDHIPCRLFKISPTNVKLKLIELFNNSISEGIFPNILKETTVTPIFKKNDKQLVENYRPISVSSPFSKIFEKLIKSQLIKHLEENNILSKNQFGFRTGHSTEQAIINLTSELHDAMDKSLKPIVIFLDIKKAFDSINFKILIYKLSKLGLDNNTLELLKNYLSARKQRTRIDMTLSDENIIRNGVPQGTILGPLFFLIYINELCNLKIKGQIISYADDTAIVIKSESWEKTMQIAEETMFHVNSWLEVNKLSLNIEKTIYVPFSILESNLPPENLKLKFHSKNCNPLNKNCNCYTLKRETNAKYLGVIIDYRLSWCEHIKYITEITRKLIYYTYRLKQIVNQTLLKRLYISLFQSIYSYGLLSWGSANDSVIYSLANLQKRIIKIMFNKPIMYPTDKLFLDTKLLDIRQLYIEKLIKYNHYNKESKIAQHKYNTRTVKLTIPRKNKSHGQRQLNYIGPRTYNVIPDEIKKITSHTIFKTELHKWIIKNRKLCHDLINLKNY
jgi:hypothetical protein